MKTFIKIFLAVAVVMAALVVALVVLASILITPERVKATLLPLAEHNLHRKIDLGEINVSLLKGIEIDGLRIYEKDGLETFLTTDLVHLRYQLLPLLTMKVVIDEVRLEKPAIRVVRLNDGKFNFSDLIDSSGVPISMPIDSTENPGTSSISLLVSEVLLQDGQLIFTDRVLNDKAPYRYELSALQIAAKAVIPTGEVPLSLQCQINGSPLSLNGQVRLAPFSGSFDIELQDLDVVPFMPYIQDKLPGKLGGLNLNLKSTVAVTPDDVVLKGSLLFAGLDLQLDALPEAPVENAKFEATFDLRLNRSQDDLELRMLSLDYNGIMANLAGNVSELSGKQSLDLAVTVPKLQIGPAINAVPDVLVGNLRSYDPTGSMTLEASLFGSLENTLGLIKSATIDLDNVQATAGGQRPAFSGRLLLVGDQVAPKDLQIRLGDNNAAVDFKVNGIYTTPMTIVADISSDRFLLESLLQGSAGPVVAADQEQSNGSASDSASELGPLNIPLIASGSIKISETIWKDLTIKDFLAQYELKDNIFKLIQMDGQVADGSFSNTASVDLNKKGLAYSANLGLKSIQTAPLLTALMPQTAGRLAGAMDLDLFLDGRGTHWQKISQTLSGNANFLVADGRLNHPELVKGFGSFLHLPELHDVRFDVFTGQFRIVDGKVLLDAQMLSDTIKLFPKGNIGLDGTMNLKLDTRLSKDLSDKMDPRGSITGYLTDNDGWTRLPLLLKGSLNSPVFGLYSQGLPKQASKTLGADMNRQLNNFFKQTEPAPQASDQNATDINSPQETDPARKVLQESLQKMFGH